jgi:hypothetical protein
VARRKTVDVATAQARYDEALKDLKQFRENWEKLGRPETERGSQLQLVPHPFIKLIRDAEVAVLRLGQAAGVIEVNRGGRPPGRASAPDRKKPDGAPRLRVVG